MHTPEPGSGDGDVSGSSRKHGTLRIEEGSENPKDAFYQDYNFARERDFSSGLLQLPSP